MIGKDILWFHAVIWPCILYALDLPLPKHLIVHGFINDAQNIKMSKSLGNVIDPKDLLEQFHPDTLRYYLVREGSFGHDLKFSIENLKHINNSELIGSYGNLVHRVLKMVKEDCQSKVPIRFEHTNSQFRTKLNRIINEIDQKLRVGQISEALQLIHEQLKEGNIWIFNAAPWREKDLTAKSKILREALERILFYTFILHPFIPQKTWEIFTQLGFKDPEEIGLDLLGKDPLLEDNMELPITGTVLFQKLV